MKRGDKAKAVIELFDREPTLTSYQLAERLDCSSEYIRATLQRHKRKLALPRGGHLKDAKRSKP